MIKEIQNEKVQALKQLGEQIEKHETHIQEVEQKQRSDLMQKNQDNLEHSQMKALIGKLEKEVGELKKQAVE